MSATKKATTSSSETIATNRYVTSSDTQNSPKQTVLYKFGILSDVQWAPIPDGYSFHGTPRYYKDALQKAHRAVEEFQRSEVDMCVHLGDIVDYHASKRGVSQEALEAIVECFDSLNTPVLHCIGNHCLYNAPRHVLNEQLGIDAHKEKSGDILKQQHSYFSFKPTMRVQGSTVYRFLVLDGYDISVLGWPEGHPNRNKALEILNAINPNEDQNSNAGLKGLDKRFVKFGGGLSDKQLNWLQNELEDAKNKGERVIVCCHQCIHPRTCPATCLLYNFDSVLCILESYAGVVAATFSGHAHSDGYCYENGIHHRVCEAVLETTPGEDCFGIVTIYEDFIHIDGAGFFKSDVWHVENAASMMI